MDYESAKSLSLSPSKLRGSNPSHRHLPEDPQPKLLPEDPLPDDPPLTVRFYANHYQVPTLF